MVVVHLTSSRFLGSVERQMLGLAQALPSEFDSVFVSFCEGGLCRDFLHTVEQRGYQGFELSHDTPRLGAAVRDLVAVLRQCEASVLCCHGYKADLLGRMAARRLGISVLAVAHGWTGESRRVRVYERLDRFGLRWMDAVVCVSHAQAEKVRRAGVAPERIHVIHDAIDSNRFGGRDPAAVSELRGLFGSPPRLLVGAAGRLSPEKGFQVLVRAASLVVRDNPSVGFVLFGEGAQRQALMEQLAARQLEGRFVLTGFRADLDRFLPHLDLLVLPSFTEGLPNIVLESFAAGVPVVATAVGGTPELVEEGVNGRLVPPGDPQALAEGIRALLADEKTRQRLGEQGRRRVSEQFTFAAQRASYQQLFARLCGPYRSLNGTSPRSFCRLEPRLANRRETMPLLVHSPERVINGQGHVSATPKTPIRVCFLIDELALGGTECQLLALLEHLDRSRVQPYLCLLRGELERSRQLEPTCCPLLRLQVSALHDWRTPAKAARFWRFLRRERIDILQVYFPDSSYLGVPIARLAGVRAIVRTRLDLGFWMKPHDRWLDRLLYDRFVDVTLVNSEAGRQAYRHASGGHATPVQILENGVDLARFDQEVRSVNATSGKRVGMVANLRPVKNPDLFVRVAADLATMHPDVQFAIAGDGEQRPQIEALVKELGLQERFALLGHGSDIPSFLAGLDVAVLCSQSESMSNALLEYLAAGRPIVATGVGGNLQMIEHEVHGLLVPPGDQTKLTQAIDRLLRDPALADRLGAAARQKARACHSHEARARRFEDFYRALLAHPPRRQTSEHSLEKCGT
jgi:glycosyltransferase involved in cell wall biosynthesis